MFVAVHNQREQVSGSALETVQLKIQVITSCLTIPDISQLAKILLQNSLTWRKFRFPGHDRDPPSFSINI